MSEAQDRELDVRHAALALWQRAWLILLLVSFASATAYFVSRSAPDRYEATAQVRVSNPNANRLFTNLQGGQLNIDPVRLIETETRVLLSGDLRTAADRRLGVRAALIDDVEVVNVPDTDLLNVTVTSRSPAVARDAANTLVDVYQSRRRDEHSADLEARAQELRARAFDLGQQMQERDEGDPQRHQLEASQGSFLTLANQYEAEAGLMKSNVQVVDRAQTPANPVSPRPWRNAGLAAALGLLLGVGVALLLDRLDDRITEPGQLPEMLPDIPLLATLPIYDPTRRWGATKLPHGPRSLVPARSVDAELYRVLRTNLRFSSRGRHKTIFMVTSPTGSEGKSTVTANLGVSLADNGHQVVVVSADLRRPTLGGFFDVDEARPGLTNVLTGERAITDCLVPRSVGNGHILHVLPAGALPPNPAELLESRLMSAVLDQIAATEIEFVLIDCPPVLPVSDTLSTAQLVDGVILVAAVGRTRAHHLAEARTRLDQVGADVVGVVLNGLPTAHRRSHHYAYPYRSYASYEPHPPSPDATASIDRNGTRPAGLPKREIRAEPRR